MADGEIVNQENTQAAVNSQEAQGSAPQANQEQQANPPAGEQSAAQGSDNRIPYPRFQQVIDERNQERAVREQQEARIRDLESRVSGASAQQQPSVDAEVERLVKELNMAPEAARAIVATQVAIAQRAQQGTNQQLRQYELRDWSRALEQKHSDYKELIPDMEKAFSELQPMERNLVVSSPVGLEMFYNHVRSNKVNQKLKESFNQGANQAYANKAQKQAVSSVPGTSSGSQSNKLTREGIKNMSLSEYQKRLPEINQALKEGRIE